nr:UBX domain containing protein 1 [Hymenolepis microstoma]
MEAFVDLLVEMGYEKGYAEQAVKETNIRGIEAALDWIAENPNEPGPSQSTEDVSNLVASSYVCEECGKKLRNDDEMQFHSAKSGHCNFSESSEKVKALTEEERKAKMEALRVALEEKKKKRLEEERQKEFEDEKRRRNQGKTFLTAKQEFKEKMERLEAEEMKRQKAADKAYRAEVLAQIEKDRAERKARQNGGPPATDTTISSVPTESDSSSTVSSDECRLQIRTPCGAPLKSTFKGTNKLVDVLQYVCNNWPDEPNGITRSVIDSEGVTLQTTFPTRKFTDEDQSSTLQELGLCPSAVIMANRLMKYC